MCGKRTGHREDLQPVRYAPGRHFFLFGDETAIPAISAIVEALPENARALVVIEIAEAVARQDPPLGRNVNWTWLVNDREPGKLLQSYARHLLLNPESAQIWLACECSAARALRCEFARLGFDKQSLHASGY